MFSEHLRYLTWNPWLTDQLCFNLNKTCAVWILAQRREKSEVKGRFTSVGNLLPMNGDACWHLSLHKYLSWEITVNEGNEGDSVHVMVCVAMWIWTLHPSDSGVYTQYKTLLAKDKMVLKRLIKVAGYLSLFSRWLEFEPVTVYSLMVSRALVVCCYWHYFSLCVYLCIWHVCSL